MCYLFCRCTRSISVVPPAQYAHLAAFRGRVLCRGGEQRHASAVHSLPWRPPERLFRSAPPTHCACPHAALRYACRAGDSETGSVSSGSGASGIEFLPVNSTVSERGGERADGMQSGCGVGCKGLSPLSAWLLLG